MKIVKPKEEFVNAHLGDLCNGEAFLHQDELFIATDAYPHKKGNKRRTVVKLSSGVCFDLEDTMCVFPVDATIVYEKGLK